MPASASPGKLTDQGRQNITRGVAQHPQLPVQIEQAGGRFIAGSWTPGASERILVVECPDEDTAMTMLLASGM